MIRAGFVIESPITGTRAVVVEGDAETSGMGWLLKVTCVPDAAPDLTEHLHLTWTETFEIIHGTAHYAINKHQEAAGAGDRITVLGGQRHIHPWNAGEDDLVFFQRTVFHEPDPRAVQDGLGGLATIAGLSGEGKVDEHGLPTNPLQLAATLRTFNKHGSYVTSVPIRAQDLLSATLGRLAEGLGYRGVYRKYLVQSEAPS